jgi:hypothetical protein
MSNYYYGPALDMEIGYRRGTLLRDAATYRLARQSRRARRAAAGTVSTIQSVAAPASAPAEAPFGASAAAEPARDQVIRAA